MRSLILLGCSLLTLAATGCGSPLSEPPVQPPPVQPPLVSQFKITLSSAQNANVSAGTYETEYVSGSYNTFDTGAPGISILGALHGLNPAANNAACQVLVVYFMGKPETGKQWQLLFDTSDGDASTAPGTGTLLYSEACPDPETPRRWISASGTLRIDSVADPDPRLVPAGSPAGAMKTVTLTVADVTMVPDPNEDHATGTFALRLEGRVALMAGMDQP